MEAINKKQGGRPLVAANVRKTEVFSFRCTAIEAAQVKEMAVKSQLSPSEFCLLATLKRRLPPSPMVVPAVNELLVFELNKIGTNINQITKKINSGVLGGTRLLEEHLEVLQKLLTALTAFLVGEYKRK